MKKRLGVIIISVLAIILCASLFTACEKTVQEEILPETVVSIHNAKDLDGIRNYTGKRYKNFKFILEKDIDLSEYERWAPIGANHDDAFQGTLDGNGHKITNLNVKGWDENGNPLLVGKGDQIEGVTAYYSVGLFGYTHAATIANVNLDVDIYYYMDKDYGFAAGLVGYNTGASRFENVNVGGRIRMSNIYYRKRIYNTDGEYVDTNPGCSSTGYIGGVVAYSVGNTVFKNVNSSVNIDNVNYYAYYRDADAVSPEEAEAEDFTPSYVLYNVGSKSSMIIPQQVFSGGITSFMKSGVASEGKSAVIADCSYQGKINITAKSTTTAGIVAAAYSVKLENCSASSVDISATARYKNLSGGIAALMDNGVMDNNTSAGVDIETEMSGTVESVNVGGLFGYACNLATIKNSETNDVTISTNYDKSSVGGVGGVIRDSFVNSCASENAKLYMKADGAAEEALDVFAVTVSSVYGNSVLKDCQGSATNYLRREAYENTRGHSVQIESTYVEDNGKPAARLYKKGSTTEYLTVFAEVKEGKLEVKLMDEELTVLSEAKYGLTDAQDKLFNPAETYLSVYFDENGFKAAESGELKAEGRDMKNYEWRSGKAVIENIEVKSVQARE